jgi:predicted transcriptional regulator
MERTDIIDAILKELHSDQSQPLNIDTYCEKHLDVHDINLIDDIIAELVCSKVIKPHRNRSAFISKKGKEIIEKHGSYSQFLSHEANAAKTAHIKERIIKLLPVIGMFLFGFWGIWQDIKNDKLETKNEQLETTRDSLSKEIEALKVPQFVVPSDSSIATEKVKEKK